MKPRRKKESFGGCRVVKVSPSPAERKYPPVINLHMSLEQALMLGLAIDECARWINAYMRSTREGKTAGVNIAVKPEMMRIDVVEGNIKDED